MKIRRLQIESQQMARIRVEIQMAGLSIEMKTRRIKAIQQQRAQMTISRQDPSVEVDMQGLRNNIGLKDIGTLTRDITSQTIEQVRQGIKNIENNGDFVAALPQRGNAIASIARSALIKVKHPPQAPGTAADPTVPVKVNPGSLSIDWSLHDISITWDDYQDPVITIEPKPSVKVSLAQEPHVAFRVVEQSYPPESGRTIDEEV